MDLSNQNIIHVQGKNTQYIQFKKLLEYKDKITHAFAVGLDLNFRTVIRTPDGQVDKSNYERAIQDFEKLCTDLNLDKNQIVRPNQMHKDKVLIAKEKINIGKPDIYLDEYAETDGLITKKQDLILSTTSADCILMLFYDPVTNTIANIHSGWRGTYKQISVKTVQKMKKELNVSPENLICCMCPSIRSCHFEVSKDVKDMFQDEFKNLKGIENIIKRQENNLEKWTIDTVRINREILKQYGLKEENIIDSGVCTVCNSNLLHSCRAEKEGFGLETAIIALK